jgi:hypothetical protein
LSFSLPAEIAGTIPGWITATTALAFFGIWVRRELGFGHLRNSDAADIRDHYAQELDRLAARVDASDRLHEECVREREELRRELREVHDELAGIKRQIARYSADALMILDDRTEIPRKVAPDATASAPRVKENGK